MLQTPVFILQGKEKYKGKKPVDLMGIITVI